MKERRVMVVHAGSRDHYQLALAFSEVGAEVHLVTDFYFRPGTLFGCIVKMILGRAVYKRFVPNLNVRVKSSLALLLLDVLGRWIPRSTRIYALKSALLARAAHRLSSTLSFDEIVFYSHSGLSAFLRLTSKKLPVCMFQMHPHPALVRDLYRDYIAFRPVISDDLHAQEEELADDAGYVADLGADAKHCKLVFCASSFTKASLTHAGVSSDRIVIAPYGCGVRTRQPVVASEHLETRPDRAGIRLAFVGQFVIRKGVYELLSAIYSRADVALTIYTRDRELAEQRMRDWFGKLLANVTVWSIADDDAMWARVAENDFLILPSLVEGFGLVISEAMSIGLPVISSKNSAGPELIKDGHSGYLLSGYTEIDIGSGLDRALRDRLSWQMIRMNAKRAAEQHTWARFRREIVSSFCAPQEASTRKNSEVRDFELT